MTRDDIIRMAREAGFDSNSFFQNINWIDFATKFASLVAAAERERMVADGWRQCAVGQSTTQFCAEAERIRAMGNA